MEIVIGVAGLLVAIVGVYFAYRQLKSSSKTGKETRSPGIQEKLRTNIEGTAYRLGFTFAKLAWHHGEIIQRNVLAKQVLTFASGLSLPNDIVTQLLERLSGTSDLKALISNAHSGLDARNAVSSLLQSQYGEGASAAFRLGFGILFIMPQIELMDMGTKAGLKFPGIESQLENIIQDARTVDLNKKHITLLKKIYSDPQKTESARVMLMELGAVIDKDLNST